MNKFDWQDSMLMPTCCVIFTTTTRWKYNIELNSIPAWQKRQRNSRVYFHGFDYFQHLWLCDAIGKSIISTWNIRTFHQSTGFYVRTHFCIDNRHFTRGTKSNCSAFDVILYSSIHELFPRCIRFLHNDRWFSLRTWHRDCGLWRLDDVSSVEWCVRKDTVRLYHRNDTDAVIK